VLARKASNFPAREYEVPLEGKVPYDFRKIEGFAKLLNSEIESDEAIDIAKQQIENLHQFLVKQDVDKVIEMNTSFEVGDSVYLHAPVWFIVYGYKHERYHIFLDGATGTVIKGDVPTIRFGLI
jgi:hypothetical protein